MLQRPRRNRKNAAIRGLAEEIYLLPAAPMAIRFRAMRVEYRPYNTPVWVRPNSAVGRTPRRGGGSSPCLFPDPAFRFRRSLFSMPLLRRGRLKSRS